MKLPISKNTVLTSAQGVISFVAGVLLLLTPESVLAGNYLNSAHGSNSTGVSRATMATANYAKGNCAHCHEQHRSVGGTSSTPELFLGFDNEEDLCQGCHASTGTVGTATDAIKTDATKTYGHHLTTASGVHQAHETLSSLDDTKHIECTDCHNPHVARTGNHTANASIYQTSSGNLISVSSSPSPLEGVKGAIPTWDTGNWDLSPGNTYTLGTATKEYEICFKCHSASNANPSGWNSANTSWSTTTGAGAWTDVGLEFNPNNLSYHPIVQAISPALNDAPINSWSVGDTMYCSDCHASDSTRAGPHGSAVKWMLAGTNKAWPYFSANNNGTATTDAARGNSVYRVLGNEASFLGTNNGLFCRNCHPNPSTTGTHHSEGGHRGSKGWYLACVDCHIRVPHGGKVERLICADNGGTMPSRYYPNGNGGDKITRGDGGTGPLGYFHFESGGVYGTEDCGAGCYSDHNYTSGTRW